MKSRKKKKQKKRRAETMILMSCSFASSEGKKTPRIENKPPPIGPAVTSGGRFHVPGRNVAN